MKRLPAESYVLPMDLILVIHGDAEALLRGVAAQGFIVRYGPQLEFIPQE
jgi:hypothetical protein